MAEGDDSALLRPYVVANFFPKFDNQEQLTKLGTVLLVTKKHSGSLLMFPPAYSKNSFSNKFSRCGTAVLRAHFEGVYGGFAESEAAWNEWIAHSETHGLCYSFEMVVPRLLGDHGATPLAAYAVLTSVSCTVTTRFLSPAELLELATRFLLPLNETWFIPGKQAREVEQGLSERRWTMNDSELSAYLDGLGVVKQVFLTHGQTQGEVLEGFVLLAVETATDALLDLVQAYQEAMAGRAEGALRTAVELGSRCHNLDPALVASFEAPLPCMSDEPVNETDVPGGTDALWQLLCADPESKLSGTFRWLRKIYPHFVRLKGHRYRGRLRVQVHILNDQVFYGWPLHMSSGEVSALYRGMVVELSNDGDTRTAMAFASAEAAPTTILEIAKLKCRLYIQRTFGIRNQLNLLLDQGIEEYVAGTQRFFRNWGVPKELQPEMRAMFVDWARYVHSLPPHARDDLRSKSYLHFLEPFLAGEPLDPSGTGVSGCTGATGQASIGHLAQYAVVVINLSGGPAEPWVALVGRGLTPTKECMRGAVSVITNPPGRRIFTKQGNIPAVAVVVPPSTARAAAQPKWAKMHASLQSPASALSLDNVTTFAVPADTQPGDAEALWQAFVEQLPEPPAPHRPERTVVAVVALPCGGGKSTLFGQLQKASADAGRDFVVIASDDGAPDFDRRIGEALAKHAWVGYDKNIPDAEGVSKLVRVLGRHSSLFDIRVIVVCPGHIEAETCWQRIAVRPKGHKALTVHMEGGEEKAREIFHAVFLCKSRAFLSQAQALPGAIVTDAFWAELDDGKDAGAGAEQPKATSAAAATGAEATAPNPLAKLAALVLESPGAALPDLTSEQVPATGSVAANRAVWASAELKHAKLHVTLVPPPSENEDPQRRDALRSFASAVGCTVTVEGSRYFTHHDPEQDSTLGYWLVDNVQGLGEDVQELASQRAVYHITDSAALQRATGRDVVAAVRNGLGTPIDHPFKDEAVVCLK